MRQQRKGCKGRTTDLLSILTEKASHLDGSERLLFAEKTALAFWKAIGGDADADDAPEEGNQ